MSIEFFRTEDQRPVDADGFELPPWENPYFAIPDQGVPSDEDSAWAAEHVSLPPIAGGAPEEEWEPSPEDWRDYHEHCLEQERLDALRRMADAEYELRMRFGE